MPATQTIAASQLTPTVAAAASFEGFKEMSSSWLYETNSVVIIIALFALLSLAYELSYRLGMRSRTTVTEYYDGNFRVLKSSLLGLMALLLAFTFSMAAQRHQSNQDLVMKESNLLYSVMLESRGLPQAESQTFLQHLARYSQARLDFFFAGRDLDKAYLAIKQTKAIHSQMWDEIQHLLDTEPQNLAAHKIHEMLVDEWTIYRQRVSVFENRVPDAVFLLLFLACTLGMTLLGFGSGMARRRERLGTLAFALLLCSVIYIVQDLDRPRRGLFVISQGPMLELKESIEQEVNDSRAAEQRGRDKMSQ
jgi:hypothetical protein